MHCRNVIANKKCDSTEPCQSLTPDFMANVYARLQPHLIPEKHFKPILSTLFAHCISCACFSFVGLYLCYTMMMTQSHGWNLQRLQHSRNELLKQIWTLKCESANYTEWELMFCRLELSRLPINFDWLTVIKKTGQPRSPLHAHTYSSVLTNAANRVQLLLLTRVTCTCICQLRLLVKRMTSQWRH